MIRENVIDLSERTSPPIFKNEDVERAVTAALNRTVAALGKRAVAVAVCLRDDQVQRKAA